MSVWDGSETTLRAHHMPWRVFPMHVVFATSVPHPIRRPRIRGEIVLGSNPCYRKYRARVNLRRHVVERGTHV